MNSENFGGNFEPLFVYLGDTSPDVFARNPDIFYYPLIFSGDYIFISGITLAECTFLHGSDKGNKYKHSSWDILQPIIQAHPTNTFILTHWSTRYSPGQIKRIVFKAGLSNVMLWL